MMVVRTMYTGMMIPRFVQIAGHNPMNASRATADSLNSKIAWTRPAPDLQHFNLPSCNAAHAYYECKHSINSNDGFSVYISSWILAATFEDDHDFQDR